MRSPDRLQATMDELNAEPDDRERVTDETAIRESTSYAPPASEPVIDTETTDEHTVRIVSNSIPTNG